MLFAAYAIKFAVVLFLDVRVVVGQKIENYNFFVLLVIRSYRNTIFFL